MRSRALLAGLVAMSIFVIAGPASAKPSIAEATITGPGLEGAIRIEAPETDGLSESGIDLGREGLVRPHSVEGLGLIAADLGPRYLVIYRFDLADDAIRQHLYPYATGGPVTYTPRGQRLGRVSFRITPGWFQSLPTSRFFEYLVDHGLPRRNPAAPAPSDEAASGAAPSAPTSAWAVVVAVAGLGALSLVALFARRRALARA